MATLMHFKPLLLLLVTNLVAIASADVDIECFNVETVFLENKSTGQRYQVGEIDTLPQPLFGRAVQAHDLITVTVTHTTCGSHTGEEATTTVTTDVPCETDSVTIPVTVVPTTSVSVPVTTPAPVSSETPAPVTTPSSVPSTSVASSTVPITTQTSSSVVPGDPQTSGPRTTEIPTGSQSSGTKSSTVTATVTESGSSRSSATSVAPVTTTSATPLIPGIITKVTTETISEPCEFSSTPEVPATDTTFKTVPVPGTTGVSYTNSTDIRVPGATTGPTGYGTSPGIPRTGVPPTPVVTLVTVTIDIPCTETTKCVSTHVYTTVPTQTTTIPVVLVPATSSTPEVPPQPTDKVVTTVPGAPLTTEVVTSVIQPTTQVVTTVIDHTVPGAPQTTEVVSTVIQPTTQVITTVLEPTIPGAPLTTEVVTTVIQKTTQVATEVTDLVPLPPATTVQATTVVRVPVPPAQQTTGKEVSVTQPVVVVQTTLATTTVSKPLETETGATVPGDAPHTKDHVTPPAPHGTSTGTVTPSPVFNSAIAAGIVDGRVLTMTVLVMVSQVILSMI
ncbi:hypothetical protein N7535_003729 [Penicillium sp. DV-2018c]|nr:hypothetical protein N7461_000570 [Penicillium sp. DV-2018c]KAJ5576803.1 hypothetical protein N7535_003729 [Penicillium sp. DV-2018c]